jgi:hypothetical protein
MVLRVLGQGTCGTRLKLRCCGVGAVVAGLGPGRSHDLTVVAGWCWEAGAAGLWLERVPMRSRRCRAGIRLWAWALRSVLVAVIVGGL